MSKCISPYRCSQMSIEYSWNWRIQQCVSSQTFFICFYALPSIITIKPMTPSTKDTFPHFPRYLLSQQQRARNARAPTFTHARVVFDTTQDLLFLCCLISNAEFQAPNGCRRLKLGLTSSFA